MDHEVKVLLVQRDNGKVFRVTVPANARMTFGPFSPPARGSDAEARYNRTAQGGSRGTLRIYKGGLTKATESILAVFTGVESFRDITEVDYEEQVTTEEVSTVWKSDQHGYRRETVGKTGRVWVSDDAALPAIPANVTEEPEGF